MKPDTYISNLLGAFATSIASHIDQSALAIEERGINAAAALVTIHNHPNDSIDVLRKVLGLTHSGAVRLVSALEKEKLVERHKSDNDRRAVVVKLTSEGQKRADSILKSRAAVTDSVLEQLSPDQQTALVPILETILKALTDGKEGARKICKLCDEQSCRPKGCPVEIAATCSNREG